MRPVIICKFCGYTHNKDTSLKCANCDQLGPYRVKLGELPTTTDCDLLRLTDAFPQTLSQSSFFDYKYDAVRLEIGQGLIQLTHSATGGQLIRLIENVRERFSKKLGISVVEFRIVDSLLIKSNTYQISGQGNVYAKGEIDILNYQYNISDSCKTIAKHLDYVLRENTFLLYGYKNLINPDKFVKKITELVNEGRGKEAQKVAEVSLQKFPDNEHLLGLTGLVEMSQENWIGGIRHLKKLIEIQKDESQSGAYRYLWMALACNEQFLEAQKVLNFALEKWPEDKQLLEAQLQHINNFN